MLLVLVVAADHRDLERLQHPLVAAAAGGRLRVGGQMLDGQFHEEEDRILSVEAVLAPALWTSMVLPSPKLLGPQRSDWHARRW